MTKNYDQLLKIETSNSGSFRATDQDDSPYEATPYSFLEILFSEIPLEKTDALVDYGSGKGRLLFYLHHKFQVKVTGVEKNTELHKIAKRNKKQYKDTSDIRLINSSAEDYKVRKTDKYFYFFNPFSLNIFKQVIRNILNSAENHPRPIKLIFYYPRQKYIDHLRDTPLVLEREILIPGLSRLNPEERFLLYKL